MPEPSEAVSSEILPCPVIEPDVSEPARFFMCPMPQRFSPLASISAFHRGDQGTPPT